jgi:hypothetical protein
MTMKKIALAVFASIAAIGAAQAQTIGNDAPHGYVGIGAATADNVTTDQYRVGGKLYGGYQFDRNWGLEAGYTYFDDQDFSRSIGNRAVKGQVRGSSSYIAGKYTIPLSERVAAYGKLGVSYNERKYRDTVGLRYDDNDTGAYGAVGLQYKLNQNASVIGEYERYGKDKNLGAKADVYTVGLQYDF